jgi:chromosome segregation ATPase
MGIEIRLPNISGSDREQLAQIRSYLYQLVPQLQWALENVGDSSITSKKVEEIAKKVSSSAATSTPSSTVDANVTFEKLKHLIIASSEIVQEYYTEIDKKLNATYFAGSSFGTFISDTKMIETNAANYTNKQIGVTQVLVSNVQDSLEEAKSATEDLNKSLSNASAEISNVGQGLNAANSDISDLKNGATNLSADLAALNEALDRVKEKANELNTTILETQAHIKTGIIDKRVDDAGNEFPVIGIEIGQIDTANGNEVLRRFARFTSGKLSFYDQNNIEIAYISNYKLYITNAEITGTLKLGGFVVETSGGLRIKWAGRS